MASSQDKAAVVGRYKEDDHGAYRARKPWTIPSASSLVYITLQTLNILFDHLS